MAGPEQWSDTVCMILGVGNKETDYGDFDVDTLQLIGNSLWHIVHSARIERALAASLEKSQTILSTISEAISLHDESGAIVEVNTSAMGIYGYGREDFLKLRFDDLIENVPPHSMAEVQAMLAAVRSGIPQDFEWQARRFGGDLSPWARELAWVYPFPIASSRNARAHRG